jgi:hypothetical protein
MADWQPATADGDLARIAFVVDALTEKSIGTDALRGGRAPELTPWQTLGDWRS